MDNSPDLHAVRNGDKKDLRGADLRGADLRHANLRGADLRGADLRGADLQDATLATLRDADLREATLRHADLSGATLKDATLRDADLRHATLLNADLRHATLRHADLRYATLLDATLRHATLWGADLWGAELDDAELPAYRRIPQEGAFIAYKYASEHLLRLQVPADADRTSCLTGAKCRAERARVTDILKPDGSECDTETATSHHREFEYYEGEMAVADDWYPDIRVACTSGIHFYASKRLAQRRAPWDVDDEEVSD